MKAFVSMEIAERTSGDESILKSLNRRLDGLDAFLEGKLTEE
jgi:hypothetical protein